jgi:type I restriction enzyme S subunit
MQVISLDQQLNFFNGKAIPKKKINVEKNIGYKVYGSNGVIGYSESYNHENAIVIGRVGAYCGSVQYELGKFWATDNTIVCRPTDLKEIAYFYYLLEFINLNQYAGGAAQPLLTQSVLNTIKVKIHDESKREFLGNFLNKIDESIGLIEKQIFIFEKLIRSNFEEWFINFKFPNHEQVKFVDGIPEGWELKSVSELTQLISRGITPKYNDESGKSIVINQKCIRDNKLNLELARRQDKEIPDLKLVQKGDVLINSTGAGTLGRVTQVHEDLPDTTVDTHVTIARPLQEISSAWFGAAISHIESYIETLGEGATNQLELKREVIGRIDLVCPAIDIQNQFQTIVEPMQQQILNLMKQNTHLLKLKETLLPRLMSGELDVSKLSSIE